MEKLPSGEFSEAEQNIINRFKEGGQDDPEAARLFVAWMDENRAEAKKGGTVRAGLEFEVRRARIMISSNFLEQSWDDLQNSLWQAQNQMETPDNAEELGDLIREINSLLDSIDPEKK